MHKEQLRVDKTELPPWVSNEIGGGGGGVKSTKTENVRRLFNVREGSDERPGKYVLLTRQPGG